MNLKKIKPVRWLVSLHEAGHAVVAVSLNQTVKSVRVCKAPSVFAGLCIRAELNSSDEIKAICSVAGDAAVEFYRPGFSALRDSC